MFSETGGHSKLWTLVIFLIMLAKIDKEGKIYFGSQFEDTAYHDGGGITAGA